MDGVSWLAVYLSNMALLEPGTAGTACHGNFFCVTNIIAADVSGQVLMWHLCLAQSSVKLDGASAKSGVELHPVLDLLFAGPSAGLVIEQTVVWAQPRQGRSFRSLEKTRQEKKISPHWAS